MKKNGKRMLQAVCKEGCPWKLWATPMNPKDSMDHSWQIKTMVKCRNCSKAVANRNITSKWMAKYYIEKFMPEPNYTMRSLGYFQGHLLTAVEIDENDCLYLIVYAGVEGPYQWAQVTDMEPLLPPIISRPLEISTKRRILELDEVTNPKLNRGRMQANCTKYEKQDHNIRTC
ncbi:hypothetical protein V6N13_125539 [Hibiscus sabdariffa]